MLIELIGDNVMNIFIYGDSNTFGQIPNINGYSKNAEVKKYNAEELWWYPLSENNNIIVNGLPGRSINQDNPWLPNRNATLTISDDLNGLCPDMLIIQLGTNDCKSRYGLTAKEITENLHKLIKIILSKTPHSQILVLSPATIKEGNKITDKYYIGAEKKSKELDQLYANLCKENNYMFVSGIDAEVGEDGEHLTKLGHSSLKEKVLNVISSKIPSSENQLCI